MDAHCAPAAAVLVKSVPVGGANLRVVDGVLTRSGVSHGIDPVNEVAVEIAVRAREVGAVGRVVAVSMGPEAAADALRRALAMGCDEAILVTDGGLAGADVRVTARVLAAAVRRLGSRLVIVGYESLDGSSGVVPAAVAALLDMPLLSRLRAPAVTADAVRGERDLGAGPEDVEAALPCVVSVVEGGVDPRYPTLRDSLAARNAQVTRWGLDGIGETAQRPGARERVVELTPVPPRLTEPAVHDGPSGVDAVLGLLADVGVRGG